MGNEFKLKAIINKNNGQINVSLPKKKLPKKLLKDLYEEDASKLKFKLEGWE